ncbi:MAG: PPC domain-containing protein, partial [Blastocatellia bacterium]
LVHPNGTLIKAASNGAVYLIQNGQRRWISSPEVLRALYQNGGFDFKDVITAAADELSSYSVGANITGTLSGNGRSQPEGRLIRQSGQAEVSIVTNNGMRRVFPNASIFLNLGYLFCNVIEVSDYYSYSAGSAVDGNSLGSGGGGGNGVVTTLNNGQSASANLGADEQKSYRINLPSGATKLTVQLTGSGDADLYVKYGSQATLSNYDCRPYLGSSNEQCVHNNPLAGDWYMMVNGYSSASYTLTVTYQTGGNSSDAPCTSCTPFTSNLANSGASNQQPNGSYYYSSTSGTHNGWLRGPAGADFDLFLFKWNGSAWERVAVSESATENEQISYTGTSGYYTWLIYSYSGSGNYSFWLQRPQ